MSAASEVEVVEETPVPQLRPDSSAIPKRKARPPTVSAQASLEPQSTASTKKLKSSPPNGHSHGSSRPEQAEFDALRVENEDLKRQLSEAIAMASRFQDDFNKLQNMRFSKPEQALSDYIKAAEERERLLTEQNQTLFAQLPRLSEFLQPHSSGTLTILTREETDAKLNAYRTELHNLRGTVEEQKNTIDELTEAVKINRLELNEEIKRTSTLTAQLSERPSVSRSSGNTDTSKNQLIIALYEDLTNIKIHSAKKIHSEELGQITELKCDCTTFGKSLYFRLELYKAPAPVGDDNKPDNDKSDASKLVDTVRFTPLNLDQEKDQAFLDGLDYLGDTFTFIREGGEFDKQMWEFGVAVNKNLRRWYEGEEDEEDDEDDEAVEFLDEE